MLDFVRSSPLFSIRRLAFCLVVVTLVVTTDVVFIHFKDVQTTTDFVTEVAIHTLGIYGGFTITALFNQPNATNS